VQRLVGRRLAMQTRRHLGGRGLFRARALFGGTPPNPASPHQIGRPRSSTLSCTAALRSTGLFRLPFLDSLSTSTGVSRLALNAGQSPRAATACRRPLRSSCSPCSVPEPTVGSPRTLIQHAPCFRSEEHFLHELSLSCAARLLRPRWCLLGSVRAVVQPFRAAQRSPALQRV
jgi:hypothetical protein